MPEYRGQRIKKDFHIPAEYSMYRQNTGLFGTFLDYGTRQNTQYSSNLHFCIESF